MMKRGKAGRADQHELWEEWDCADRGLILRIGVEPGNRQGS